MLKEVKGKIRESKDAYRRKMEHKLQQNNTKECGMTRKPPLAAASQWKGTKLGL